MKHVARRRVFAVPNSEVCFLGSDFVDYVEGPTDKIVMGAKENVFSVLSALSVMFSTVMYVTDLLSSASVCYYLHLEGELWWFLMNLIPLVLSLVVVNAFSIRWYIHDLEESKGLIGPVSKVHNVLRTALHASFLGPVMRYLELFVYGLESLEVDNPKREAFKVMVLQEERDISLLALIGSFMKSAPQLVLEVYILVQKEKILTPKATRAQLIAIAASIVTLSAAFSSYHRALRRSMPSKLNMTVTGTIMQFLSHCCIISCRVCTLALFAAAYRHWFFLMVGLHWCLMTAWLVRQKTTFCSTDDGRSRQCDETTFNAIMAVVYVFCFMNVKDEPTRWKYTFYYFVVWSENVALSVLWFLKSEHGLWFRLSLVVSVLASFVSGLFILLVYYKYFHPNKVSKVTTFVKMST